MVANAKRERSRPRDDLDRLEEEFRGWNKRQSHPLPECPTCHHPTLDGDWDDLFTGVCTLCGCRALSHLIDEIVDRLGRDGAIIALMRLAGKRD